MVMDGSPNDDDVSVGGSSSANGFSSMQRSLSLESLPEWRFSDQVENETPSTSPSYWDSEEDDDAGPKPSDLCGKFTWKIENFSQISKRELRSNMFEVGGYSWYILIYPQGCDACNHLSLFLCVANHDNLLPGWGHYALFTIVVVNKDPKKNKYNDTLHKFWKKEHDWGWKKFLEQTKVTDGFVDDDTLTIKAQVQVIREKAHRPFRCLDFQYRRELIRVYLSNVEQTCGRFVDEEKQKLQTLVGDKAMWSSFHTFWLGIDEDTRCYLSRDKTDAILKKVVKHFFIEKEVSSTLVMDCLYSGLRALESKNKIKKLCLGKDEESAPFILIENDMFILADDVFLLLERAALELPRLSLPSKGEKGLPNRAKDGCSGDDFNRDSVLRDERRLTELGRKTLEIYILADIFSNRIRRAHHEAVALKMQEELIREEEAAEQAENEKREKRSKKKQAKQRRNNRKSKDGGNEEKSVGMMTEKILLKESSPDDQILTGDAFDVSDPGNYGVEALQLDLEYRDASQIHHTAEACTSGISNGHAEKNRSHFVDDISSTSSPDSLPSVVNGPFKEITSPTFKNTRNSIRRVNKQQNKETRNSSTSNAARLLNANGSSSAVGPEPKGMIYAFKDQVKKLEKTFFKSFKEEVGTITRDKIILNDQIEEENPCISGAPGSSSFTSHSKKTVIATEKAEQVSTPDPTSKILIKTEKIEEVLTSKPTSKTPIFKTEKSASLLVKPLRTLSISKSEAPNQLASSISRPSSAPVIPSPKPTVSFASTSPTLSSKPSLFSQSSEPQSYRNVILGINTATIPRKTGPNLQTSSSSVNPGIIFGSVIPESLHNIRIGDNYDFPHLDIINDLLDEDGMATVSGYPLDYLHPLNWRQNFPTDTDPLYGPCQLDLPEYYYDNGSDALLQNRWPVNGVDVPMVDFGTAMNGNGYAYQIPEYSACGVGGYNVMYRPADGV